MPNISETNARVVIADDHSVVRAGLRHLLANPSPGFERPFDIVAEASNGVEAVAAVKQHQPDLLLLDVSMPLAGGAEVVLEVQRWSPKTRIAVFTGLTSNAVLEGLVAAGVDGLFAKGQPESELLQHLPLLLQGGTYISPMLLQIIEASKGVQSLTRRERQTLNMLISGKNNREIAQTLNLSEKTVGNHRTHLMAKLNVHSLAELLAYALEAGLLSAGETP